MNIRQQFHFESNEVDSYLKEDIAVIKIKCRVFETITDLADSGRLLAMIQAAERIPDVKALLLINEPGCMGDDEYEKFLRRILARGIDPYADDDTQGVIQKVDRAREINVLNRTISHLIEFKKVAVMGMRGTLVTPFIGASLAADFRYACEDTVLSLAHLRFGLHPSGALPFFLNRYLPHSTVMEILLKGEKITAQKALELGLISKILPKEDFEQHCLKEIEKICHLDTRVIHSTKLLANFSRVELRKYFDLEAALLH